LHAALKILYEFVLSLGGAIHKVQAIQGIIHLLFENIENSREGELLYFSLYIFISMNLFTICVKNNLNSLLPL
jgi:hypothetical protein